MLFFFFLLPPPPRKILLIHRWKRNNFMGEISSRGCEAVASKCTPREGKTAQKVRLFFYLLFSLWGKLKKLFHLKKREDDANEAQVTGFLT